MDQLANSEQTKIALDNVNEKQMIGVTDTLVASIESAVGRDLVAAVIL